MIRDQETMTVLPDTPSRFVRERLGLSHIFEGRTRTQQLVIAGGMIRNAQR